MTRIPAVLLCALVPGIAFSSAVPEDTTLDQVVERATTIVVAERVGESTHPSKYCVKDAMFDVSGTALAGDFTVEGANDELFKQIGEAQKAGRPYPIPILPVYRPAAPFDINKTSPVILFLFKLSEGKYKFVVEGAAEQVTEKKTVLKSMLRLKKPTKKK